MDALDYMLKLVGYTTFAQRLSRALSRMRRRERTYITVPIKGGAMKLAVEDITFVESQGHRLIYHTAEDEYVSAGTIKDAEEKLEGYHFFRSNKGYLLNLAHVDGIQDDCALVESISCSSAAPARPPSWRPSPPTWEVAPVE